MKPLQRIVFLVTLLWLVVTGIACNQQQASGNVEESPPENFSAVSLTPVQVVTPKRGAIASNFETTSRVEAENRVEVLSKGTGQCLEIKADVGDTVEAGQTLALLERDELEAQVRQARITVQQQKTAYEIAERSFVEGIAASVDRDNTRFAYEQARVALEMAELQLGNQTICAPISGVITRRAIQPGMVISPGLPVFSIVDPESFVLPINVPEKELARLRVKQMAHARIDAFPDRVFAARVRRIFPSIDPMSGTVRVLLDFEESERSLLRESAFARVRLVMDMRENALLLPREAILEEEGRKYVFTVETETKHAARDVLDEGNEPIHSAQRRDIKTGIEQSDAVEILEGLTEESLVVVMGQYSLKPGAPVKITNLEEELASRASMTLEEALEAAGRRETVIRGDRSSHSLEAIPF